MEISLDLESSSTSQKAVATGDSTCLSKLRFKVLRVSWVVFVDVEHLTAEAALATAPQCSISFQILAEVCVFLFTALTA